MKMATRDPYNDLFSGLEQKAVPVMVPREGAGVSLCHRVQLLAIIPYGLMRVPIFWGEYPEGSTFPFPHLIFHYMNISL